MAKKNDSLGNRMKGYEGVSRNFLTRRVPAIIRLDGKAFHTFTKGMEKPFDLVLTQAMQETMKYLCENIQGCDPRNPDQKITVCRNRWIIDHEIPIFTQDREYIERLI